MHKILTKKFCLICTAQKKKKKKNTENQIDRTLILCVNYPQAYLKAVRNNRGDLRQSIAESKRQLADSRSLGPRILAHTTRSNKVIDTEKTLERSELKPGGQIVTERKTTIEHEEV